MRNPCCEKKDINKGAWSKQEDEKLIDYIRTHGEGHWHSLPKAAGSFVYTLNTYTTISYTKRELYIYKIFMSFE